MAAAITLVPAAPVPGAGSAMAPAGGEAPDPEAPDSKTPIVSSDDGEKDEDITPAVPEPAAPSTGPTSAPPSTPARPPVWWTNDPVLRARIEAGCGDALGLVWIKNKGYPWWPARLVPVDYQHKVNPGCKRPLKDPELALAYQYYGTLEYQWIAAGCKKYPVVSFAQGWRDGHWAFSKRKPLMGGVGNTCEVLINPETQIPGFFDYVAPPTPEVPEKTVSKTKDSQSSKKALKLKELKTRLKEKKLKAKQKAKEKEKAKKAKEKEKEKVRKMAETFKGKVKVEASSTTKRSGEPADTEPAAKKKREVKYPGLAALTDFPKSLGSASASAQTTFELPFDVKKLGKPPFYKTLQRCQWVCSRPPRQFPRDEVEQCLCVPTKEMRVAMFVAREAEQLEKASKKIAKAAGVANGVEGSEQDNESPSKEQGDKETSPSKDKAQEDPKIEIPKTGCGPGCFNRASFTTCDTRVCPCGSACSNRPFHLLKSPKTKTLLTENRGWGLFANEFVAAGTFIIEYCGEIIDDKTTEQRLWADKAKGEDNFYLMEVSNSQMIDARHKGNLSRFINSSCHPNCETQKWQDTATGETRVGIFSIEDIEVGQEFTYDYNFAHFGGEGTTSFTCMCGHPLCRGTLDANPERTRNYGRRVEIRWADGGYYKATVLSYHNKTGKYLVHYDAGEKEHISLEGPAAPEHKWLTAPTTKVGEQSKAVKELEENLKKKKEEKKNAKPKRKKATGPKRIRKPDLRRVKKVEQKAEEKAEVSPVETEAKEPAVE